jgi:hypothetical protein
VTVEMNSSTNKKSILNMKVMNYSKTYAFNFKRNLIICLILIVNSGYKLFSQNAGSGKIFESQNIGTARSIGDEAIYSLAIFCSAPGQNWTVDEKKKMMEKDREAMNWIIQQSKAYGKKTTYQSGIYFKDKEDFKLTCKLNLTLEELSKARPDVDSTVSKALKSKGFNSPKQFTDFIIKKFGCKGGILVKLYIKGIGFCFANATYQSNSQVDRLETVVLCEKHSESMELYPASIAHETLHLFGAWDLYNVHGDAADIEAKAKEMLTNSIMLHSTSKINNHVIDELTAWRVGLTSVKKDWYMDLLAPQYKY